MDNNNVSRLPNGIEKPIPLSVLKRKDLFYSQINDHTKNLPRQTIPNCLESLARGRMQFPVLKYKSDPKNDYDITVTMEKYLHQIKNAARSFIKLGLEPKAAIGIIGFNHPSWFISQLGGIFAGAVACGIYTTNNADICKFIMNDCNCQIAIVENDEQLIKILSILPDIPHLKAIVKYTGTVTDEFKNKYSIPIYTWTEFLNIESDNVNVEMEKRIANIKPDDCAILIYTSGTTGLPKGVMLSHDNVIFTTKMAMEHIGIKGFEHSLISYLPLSHIAANLVDIISTVSVGTTVYFAQPDALKGSLGKTLKEVRPTMFIGVPRVFEKIQEQMQEIGAKSNCVRKRIACWAKSVGYRSSMDKINHKPLGLSYRLANCLVFSRVREALGLDRCQYLASAAAPLSQQTLDYFLSLDISISQIYGMSECCGPHTLGVPERIKLGSAGTVLNGVELRIAEPNDSNIGEICMRGRHVFLGYFNAEEKTRETLDPDGWLHSGDLGKMEDDEFLVITGRIKELIITAGGENVAPVPIEEKIKEKLSFISNAMLIGDKQKFISCLLTLKTIVNPDTQSPTDVLTPAAVRGLNEIGIQATHAHQIQETIDPILKKFIDNAISQVNSTSVSRAAYIQKWSILPTDFSISGGELGPTMKIKRNVVTDKYSGIINEMYAS